MNLNSTQQCRLCLETSADPLNIYEKFHDSDIASVLIQHFRFQIDRNDDLPEWVCEICWIHTKTFHLFYKRLELRHQNQTNSVVLVKVSEIKQKRSVSPMEEGLDSELSSGKCDEETDIKVEETQLLIRDEDSDDEDNNDNSCNQSEAEQSIHDDESGNSYVKSKKRHRPTRSDIDKQDAEIRSFFTMKCDMCDDVHFDTFKAMTKHYREVHNKRSYMTCCGNKYKSRFLMLDHIQYHLNPNAHRCDQCGKSYKGRQTLEEHIKSHVNPQTCNICSKSFTSAAALRQHVRYQHSTNETEKFHCDMCSKDFTSKNGLISHMKKHDSTKSYVCDVCGRAFKGNKSLQIHTGLEHSERPPSKVQCDICGTWLRHKGRLKAHFKWHQEEQEAKKGQVYKCPICKKEVRREKLLRSHIQYSHGERSHKCTFCDKAFKTSKSLKEHTALHTGAYLYSCPYCDRTFKSNANMYNHRKKAHLAEWTRDREKI